MNIQMYIMNTGTRYITILAVGYMQYNIIMCLVPVVMKLYYKLTKATKTVIQVPIYATYLTAFK